MLDGKVILITGASQGIGAEVARQLSAKGAKLALAARQADKLQVVAADCHDAICIPTDVSNQQECQAMVDKTIEHYGKLDILVNNAGVSMWSRFEDVTDFAFYEKIMQVNYLGSVYCTYAALPHLKASKGLIVAISSLAGKTGVPFRSGYVASKHAVQGFFDAIRLELMDYGVAVSVISPSYVETSTRKSSFSSDGTPLGHNPQLGSKKMSTEQCASIIVDAIDKRKREVLMGWRGKLLNIGKLVLPSFVDHMARKSVNWDKHFPK